ncbi:hypothetical protein X474_03425 [Dethiosulfatarculus sandiegensis]|uniref:Uncharacterized protein n=2 Tax=Dethiosulfatarculus sandiegensis TaxID=1429043 RepID=A0A0D2GKX6_9BACT|nr:hypothetical protein X474_03425 [Dethiosulfatarculus sandiegensis]
MRLGKIIDMVNLPPNLPDNLDSATLDLPGLGELPILDMRRQKPGKVHTEDDHPCAVVAELEGTDPSILVGVILDSFFPC